MPVIAVVNRKGGSGKSTLATHLSAWLSRQGAAVMLGDVDRQQSTKAWLKRRSPELPVIASWSVDQRNVLKVPPGISHVVLDTPGGMHGLELARVVMSADAILVPVCNSLFDRESAAACVAELSALPRIASGRCQLGVVGMRLDARTKGAETLRQWSNEHRMNFLGVLRETQAYVRGLETGTTLFDAPHDTVAADLAQWEPILQWLRPVTRLAPPLNPSSASTPPPASVVKTADVAPPIAASRAASLMPAQETLVHGSRLNVLHTKPESGAPAGIPLPPILPGHSHGIPPFLQRQAAEAPR